MHRNFRNFRAFLVQSHDLSEIKDLSNVVKFRKSSLATVKLNLWQYSSKMVSTKIGEIEIYIFQNANAKEK